MHIATDFAETLAKERPIIKWVLFELAYGNNPIWWKMLFAINSFVCGVLSIIFGKFRYTSEWSARLAYKNFRGISEDSIKHLVYFNKNGKYLLNLNQNFTDAISEIRKSKKISDEEHILLSIHSQGTCKKIIENFIERSDIKSYFDVMKIKISEIFANQLEVSKGRLTGNIIGQTVTKYNKIDNIPKGCIFVGDNHDEKTIIISKCRNFEFINLQCVHKNKGFQR